MKKRKLFVVVAIVLMMTVCTGCLPLLRAVSQQNNNQQQTTTQPESQAQQAQPQPLTFTTVNVSGDNLQTYLPDDDEMVMQSLSSDYNKISWGVRYTPDNLDGLVISVTVFQDLSGEWCLAVGFTNRYDTPIRMFADGYPKGSDGIRIGYVTAHAIELGTGSTYIQIVSCSGVPTGEIHWDTISVTQSYFREYVYWEADYSGEKTESEIHIDYQIHTEEASDISDVTILLVNEDGLIVDYGSYIPEESDTNEYDGEMTFTGLSVYVDNLDVAIFANPVKESEGAW